MWNVAQVLKKRFVLAAALSVASTGLATPAQACQPGGCGGGGYRGVPMTGSFGGYGGYRQPYAPQSYPPQYSYQPSPAYQPTSYQAPAPAPQPSPAPVAAQPQASPSSGTGILLMADKDLGGSVNYSIEGNAYQMAPGQTQNLDGSRTWTIRFDRGGSFGQAAYSVSNGAYEWVVTDRGWDLRSKTFTATLDNTRNATEFNFVVSDRQDVVPAGQVKTITSRMPLVITYDRGDGGPPARKQLGSGPLYVGVNLTTNLVDVFAGSPPMSVPNAVPTAAANLDNLTPPAPQAQPELLPPAPAPEPAVMMASGH